MDLKVAEQEERKQKFRERGTRPEKTAQQPKGVARRFSMTRGRELTELAKRKSLTAGAQVDPGHGGEGKWGAGADEDGGAGLSPPAPAVQPPGPAGTFADPWRTAPETPAEPPSPQKLVRVLFVLQNVPPMADIAAEVPAGPPTGAAAARALKRQAEAGAESVEADAVMEAAEAPPDE
jgi:hypothetical protein